MLIRPSDQCNSRRKPWTAQLSFPQTRLECQLQILFAVPCPSILNLERTGRTAGTPALKHLDIQHLIDKSQSS
jgi:hypothetical protein